jgi:hypothetical protein
MMPTKKIKNSQLTESSALLNEYTNTKDSTEPVKNAIAKVSIEKILCSVRVAVFLATRDSRI